MELTINGERVECALSVYTLVIYEQEFDGVDMISDINGKVYASDAEGEEGVLFDFSKIPWKKVMQGAWAMLKTADESVPHFEKWAKTVKEVDSFELRDVLSDAMSDAFFHQAAPVGEGE